MEDEKRKAGSYEIIQAFRIGDREIVLGEDLNAKPEERYMCAYCQQNEIAALYNAVMVSDDYCEIVKLFADRLSEQAEKTRAEVLKPKFQGIDVTPLPAALKPQPRRVQFLHLLLQERLPGSAHPERRVRHPVHYTQLQGEVPHCGR